MLSEFQSFVNKYNFDGFTIEKIITKMDKNGNYKKYPQFLPTGWNDYSNININHKIGCIKTGKKSNISVIDFDDHKQYDTFFEEFPQLKKTLTIRTHKGYHCFYKYNPGIPSSAGCFKNYKDGIYNKLDGRNDGNFIFSVGSKYYHNGLKKDISYDLHRDYEMLDFPYDILNTLVVSNKTKTKEKYTKIQGKKHIKTNNINLTLNKDELFELGNLIRITDLDCYIDWVYIVMSIKSFGEEYKDFARDLSKKSNRYEENSFNDLWDYYENCRCSYKFFQYAKIGNEEEYYKIRAKYMDNIDSSDADISKLAFNIFGNLFIKETKDTLKYYNGVYWECDDYESKLNRFIKEDLVKFYQIKKAMLLRSTTLDLNKIRKDKKEQENVGEEVLKMIHILAHLDKAIEKCKSTKGQNDIRSQFKKDIWNNNVKWENKPELYCFSDKVYDLKQGCFINPNPDDYLYLNTGYQYKEAKKEHITELMNIIKSIFPVEEELDYYLQLLSTGLIGTTLDKFVIANGSGRNGKGLLHELFLKTLGEYGYEMVNTVMLKPLEVGTCPELANAENKRFIIIREPAENKQLELSTIKDLTGGNTITARTHHSKKTQLQNCGSYFGEFNAKSAINGRIDNSAKERLIDVLFRSEFVDSEDVDESKYKYEKKQEYKTDLFKEKYKYALFHILKDYAKTYLNNGCKIGKMPKEIQERTNEYLSDNDKLGEFINDYLEQEEGCEISVKELFTIYKESEYYNRLSNIEKRSVKLGRECFAAQTRVTLGWPSTMV
jgi:phage/plasmid-associated DNA primase